MITIGEWLQTSPLEPADKRVLAEFVTGANCVSQIIHPERPLSNTEFQRLEEFTQRRLGGEPIPYIIEIQEFYGRKFSVNPSVLIPRPDTECLVEWLIRNLPANACVCDIGTGSGCIATTLSLERADLRVLASDISLEALKIAVNNSQTLGAKVNFFAGCWLQAYPKALKIDAVISNPPYIHPADKHLEALRFEPLTALTDQKDGLSAYREILKECVNRSIPPATIALEHGFDQEEPVHQIFEENGLLKPRTYKDYGGNVRFTVWQRQ